MKSVMFSFHPDVPVNRQKAILDEIGSWQQVVKAAWLNPDTRQADILRMAYAYVDSQMDVQEVVERLSKLSEIESASLPTRRKLICADPEFF